MKALGLTLLVCFAACGSNDHEAKMGEDASAPRVAKWVMDDDANVAFPACANCDHALERSHEKCDNCGTKFVIKAKTIDCPECAGHKHCAHCTGEHKCDLCDGECKCTVCEGSGKVDGETCPDCEGHKHCAGCVKHEHAPGESCEHCEGKGHCANCDNSGKIELK